MVSTVVSTGQVAHLWANRSQPFARTSIPSANGGGLWQSGASSWSGSPRTWFRGPTLYSYNEPIARLVEGADGLRYALVTAGRPVGDVWNPADYQKWSVATSNHMPGRALDSHVESVFYVPSIAGRPDSSESHGEYDSDKEPAAVDHGLNLEFLRHKFHLAARSFAKRASVPEWHRTNYSADGMNREVVPLSLHVPAELLALWHAANEYQAAFAVPSANPWSVWGSSPWPESADAVRELARPLWERLERLEAERNTPEKVAAREASRAKAKATKERREALRYRGTPAERVAEWRAGASVDLLRYDERTDADGGALLRVRGKRLETSQGADVPLADAVRVFRFVKLCKERGEGWRRNGARVPVGGFQVDWIDADGNFKAGCHLINWPEIVSAATQAGVLDLAPVADAVEGSRHA